MPIDPQKALGAELKPADFSYTDRDVMLYALGCGAGLRNPTAKEELQFTYENGLKVLPTYGVIPAFPALLGMGSVEGIKFNPMMLLHGEQYLEIKKHPIPVAAKTTTKGKIKAIYDKGKGAVVIVAAETFDDKGNLLFYNEFSSFLRGEGGFGGDRGPEPGYEAPSREPDAVHEEQTLPHQALIYRLSGDRNPLHADPMFAKMGGFDKPILHGLCFFGYAGRAILEKMCGNDPSKFKSIKVRFAGSVFPGETLVTKMWKDGNTVLFNMLVKERGKEAITNAAVELNP